MDNLIIDYNISSLYKSSKFSLLNEDMGLYPKATIAPKLCATVCGTLPIVCSGKPVYPEYARAFIFPVLMRCGMPFYNACITKPTSDAVTTLYRSLARSSVCILSIYGHPYVPYLDAAIMLYCIATRRQHFYVITPTEFDVTQFTDMEQRVMNIPGSASLALTRRQRIFEVYKIILSTVKGYEKTTPDRVSYSYDNDVDAGRGKTFRECFEHQWHKVDPADATLSEKQEPFDETAMFTRIMATFRECKSDVADILRCIYLLSCYLKTPKETWEGSHIPGVLGDSVGRVACIIGSRVFTKGSVSKYDTEHQNDLRPLFYFLNVLLGEYEKGVDPALLS
jgi:hypothetical protein